MTAVTIGVEVVRLETRDELTDDADNGGTPVRGGQSVGWGM